MGWKIIPTAVPHTWTTVSDHLFICIDLFAWHEITFYWLPMSARMLIYWFQNRGWMFYYYSSLIFSSSLWRHDTSGFLCGILRQVAAFNACLFCNSFPATNSYFAGFSWKVVRIARETDPWIVFPLLWISSWELYSLCPSRSLKICLTFCDEHY